MRSKIENDETLMAEAGKACGHALAVSVPVRMSPAGFEAFMAALSGPATAVPEMIEFLARPAPWETKVPR